ncbi:hypothetical protein GCM10020331_033880 [Ectobacillus funiculus]
MLYHAVYGIYIAFTAKHNVNAYSYFRNWMFFDSAFYGRIPRCFFIAWHVWQTRIAAALGQEVDYEMMENIFKQSWYVYIFIQ